MGNGKSLGFGRHISCREFLNTLKLNAFCILLLTFYNFLVRGYEGITFVKHG